MSRKILDRVWFEHQVGTYPYENDQSAPPGPDTSLRNVDGVNAAKSVNADRAKEIGHRIFDSMTGKKVDECTFKREDQAVTLGKGKLLKVGKDEVQVETPYYFFKGGTSLSEVA